MTLMKTNTIALKFTQCLDCKAQVTYRTTDRVCCEPCSALRVKLRKQRAATVQRRKRGVAAVKGTDIYCLTCGVSITRTVVNEKYCNTCSEVARYEMARKNSKQKYSTAEGKAYANEWRRNRLKTDPKWSVAAHFSTLIHRALEKKKAGRSWREFVPYSLDELMLHLERQFLPGMSWENRGEWHVDHIVPKSSFKFTSADCPEFKAAWALTNLRPLWATENLSKNAKRTFLL